LKNVVQELRQAVQAQDAGLSDAQLLEHFLGGRREAAFEAMLRRHGPMVWAVCRRVLRHAQDAEDAFQATFLVLVRKAGAIRRPNLLGNWLYGVAYRTALHARSAAGRRLEKERHAARPEVQEEDPWRELRAVLDRELSRLPDHYRVAVVLCDLEGKTYKEAARQAGCPEGTLAARLSRGRALLARRLARQGLTLSGPAAVAALAQVPAGAGPAAALLAATTRAAALAGSGGTAAAGVISTQASGLAEGVLRVMFLTKLKIAALVVVAVVGLLGTGAGLLLAPAPADEPAGQRVESGRAGLAPAAVPAITKEQLRYGGKSFDEWRRVLLIDLKPEMRVEAINALSTFGPNGYASEAITAILEVMRTYQDLSGRDQDALKVSDAGVKGIARIGAAAMPALVSELQHGKRNSRQFAVLALLALGQSEPKAALPVLSKALQDADVEVRREAVQAVRQLDTEGTSVPMLAKILANEREAGDIRSIAVEVLINLSNFDAKVKAAVAKAAVPALLTAAKDRNVALRRRAFDTLAVIKPEAGTILPVLTPALSDKDRQVRMVAAQMVEGLGASARDAVSALVGALKATHDPDEQMGLVKALGAIGPGADEAIPVLTGLLASDDPRISAGLRQAIQGALRRMKTSG
jgi:RNA polymerase sigma factor (sigma-70 family)